MKVMTDYHMHTWLCNHATGRPEEYAEQALRIGLSEIGFSDHAPLVRYESNRYAMEMSQLGQYHEMVEAVRRAYPALKVRTGIEADFFPGSEDRTRSILDAYPYDYVLGSVHFIGDWAMDDPELKAQWAIQNVDDVYREYYRLLCEAAQTGLFDIVAHMDLVKKFGYRPKNDLADVIEATAEVLRRTGLAVEINTSGLRKPVAEAYPSPAILKVLCRHKVPITFGSDAHDAKDVGRDFDAAAALAREAGYTEYVTYSRRKIEKKLPL